MHRICLCCIYTRNTFQSSDRIASRCCTCGSQFVALALETGSCFSSRNLLLALATIYFMTVSCWIDFAPQNRTALRGTALPWCTCAAVCPLAQTCACAAVHTWCIYAAGCILNRNIGFTSTARSFKARIQKAAVTAMYLFRSPATI